MIYIGIDPGLNGALATIDDNYQETWMDDRPSRDPLSPMEDALFKAYPTTKVSVFDTPTMEVESSGKVRNKYNLAAMAAMLRPYQGNPEVLVVLENVHSMPSQGVSSSFSFGEGLGMWEGIIAAYGLPLEKPSPQRWKKEMMADQGKDKDAARFRAIQLFPQMAEQLSRKKDDGRAEALLMAEYGRRIRKGR